MQLKKHVLIEIYTAYHNHIGSHDIACTKGCATCCSQNVQLTALEGRQILDYVVEHDLGQWLLDQLAGRHHIQRASQTTNQFAQTCLTGEEGVLQSEAEPAAAACPFLENGQCPIYQVRPLSCRCLFSHLKCTKEQAAVMPDHAVAAATAMHQLVEHLGQGDYWGNMLDLLPVLCSEDRYAKAGIRFTNKDLLTTARLHLLQAEPLPTFLLTPQDHALVAPLIEEIFNKNVAGKTIEDILNGK